MALHLCRFLLQPHEYGIQRSDLPVLVCQKRHVKVQTVVLPQVPPSFAAGMGHVAEDGEHELFWWVVRLHNLEQQRDDAIASCVLLPFLAQTAEVEHRIKDLVGYLSEMFLPFSHRMAEHINQKVNSIRRVKRVEYTRAHGHILDKLEHGDLVGWRHPSEVLEHR
jgi:hypothetical protein